MVRVSCSIVLVLILILLPIGMGQQQSSDAHHIQVKVLGIDGHNDTAQRVLIEKVDIGQRLSDGMVDIPRLEEGGVHVPFFALWVPTYYKGSEAVRRTLQLWDAMQGVFNKYPDRIEVATSAEDIERIVGTGKIAAVLTLEGGHQIADDVAVLRAYRRMGILGMTLTHLRNNDWADSSTDKPEHNGLTEFGKQVIQEMNAVGMIVDVSHVSDKTFYDTLSVTKKPVIASHSSCRSFADIPRNMTDDMLRAIAQNGGVVGVNFASGFLNQEDADEAKKDFARASGLGPDLSGAQLDRFAAKEHLEMGAGHLRVGHATVEDAARCIDHIARVAGIDHVGTGSDFDGARSVARGLEDASKMPSLTAALLKRGYSETDIQKIMGGNFLRVVREVVGH